MEDCAECANMTPEARRREFVRLWIEDGKYLMSDEGQEMMHRLELAVEALRRSAIVNSEGLADAEARAFFCIEGEMKRGRSTSVREVAAAMGLRSSRSGHRAIRALEAKGLIRRDPETKEIRIAKFL